MHLLRIHLHIRLDDEQWVSIAASDLRVVSEFWRRNCTQDSPGVLDIGFAPSDPHDYESRLVGRGSTLFATDAALNLIPDDYSFDGKTLHPLPPEPSQEADLPEGAPAGAPGPATQPPPRPEPPAWLRAFIAAHPRAAPTLHEAHIRDEASYLHAEHSLPNGLREQIGIFRFEYKGGNTSPSLAGVLQATPPWGLDISCHELAITFGTRNVLRMYGIMTLRELLKQHDRFVSLPEVTDKRLDEIRRAIASRIRNGISAIPNAQPRSMPMPRA